MVSPNETIGLKGGVSARQRRREWRELRCAREMGLKARELLTLPGFSAGVLAVLSDMAYLSTREGEILWICPEGSPRHRRCILASLPPAVARGEKIYCEFPILAFHGGALIDLSAALEWNPSGLVATKRTSPAERWAFFRRLLGVLHLLEVPEGMGGAVRMAYALVENKSLPSSLPDTLTGRIKDSMLSLAGACLERDLGSVVRRGREIVGLGPGLTPSGDDFLGGLLFTARSLQKIYPEKFPWREDAISELLDWARTRTHPISHAILSDLARGHGPEPLHDLVTGLLGGTELDPVMKAVLRLADIGHSSGWDMLAGVMIGMGMVKRSLL